MKTSPVTEEMIDRVNEHDACPLCEYSGVWGSHICEDDRRKYLRELLEKALGYEA